MEIKINKEIRDYTESVFFGLTIRQLIFSAAACVVAGCIYFVFKDMLGTETVSWICLLAAAPFAVLGFVKYNGMTAERFVWAWIKSEIMTPQKLVYKSDNLYYELCKPYIERREKEVFKSRE